MIICSPPKRQRFLSPCGNHICHFIIAERVNDKDVMKLLKLIVKAGGKRGISQGGPLSPHLSNIYLNEVDKMLERAKEVSKLRDGYDHIEYVRWADDLIILIDGYRNGSG